MIFAIGGRLRPNNEAVAQITISPVYDVSKKITHYYERWDVTGRIVNYPIATQAITTAALARLKEDLLQTGVNLQFLEDLTRAPTALKLLASNCLTGPYITEFAIPTSPEEVYATGIMYRVLYEAKCFAANAGSNLLEFQETVSCTRPGGREMVYVGGSVNYPERQLGRQWRTWEYVQAGTALGATAYPLVPPPIWPFALVNPDGRANSLASPRLLGKSPSFDSEFAVSWEYRYEWHTRLNGIPFRRFG
jgi:hypothetical protein